MEFFIIIILVVIIYYIFFRKKPQTFNNRKELYDEAFDLTMKQEKVVAHSKLFDQTDMFLDIVLGKKIKLPITYKTIFDDTYGDLVLVQIQGVQIAVSQRIHKFMWYMKKNYPYQQPFKLQPVSLKVFGTKEAESMEYKMHKLFRGRKNLQNILFKSINDKKRNHWICRVEEWLL